MFHQNVMLHASSGPYDSITSKVRHFGNLHELWLFYLYSGMGSLGSFAVKGSHIMVKGKLTGKWLNAKYFKMKNANG